MSVELKLTPEQQAVTEHFERPERIFAKKMMGFESLDHMHKWLTASRYILTVRFCRTGAVVEIDKRNSIQEDDNALHS